MSDMELLAAAIEEVDAWSRITHGSPGGGWTIEVCWPHGQYENGVTRTKTTRASGADLNAAAGAALASKPQRTAKTPLLKLVGVAR